MNNNDKYSQQLVGDSEGLKVVVYPKLGEHLAQRMYEAIGDVEVLEVCCGVGAGTIWLATYFPKVYAVDINPERIEAAKENIANAGLSEKVEFLTGDIFDSKLTDYLKTKSIGLVNYDQEWTTSGIYRQDHAEDIHDTNPDTEALFKHLSSNYTSNIVMRLPKSINLGQVRSLNECEVEGAIKDDVLKCYYVYFGDLAQQAESEFRFTM